MQSAKEFKMESKKVANRREKLGARAPEIDDKFSKMAKYIQQKIATKKIESNEELKQFVIKNFVYVVNTRKLNLEDLTSIKEKYEMDVILGV